MRDLHTHTVFSDGKDTPEAMILAAIEGGFSEIGISDHSYTAFDPDYCMGEERYGEYIETLAQLKEEYADRIRVRIGMEVDYYSDKVPEGLDYVIGSVHYIKVEDGYFSVDISAEDFKSGVQRYFGGDYYRACEAYYELVGKVADVTGARIIGHFDLITKFNEGDCLFSTEDSGYTRAAINAVDQILKNHPGMIFEVNTGAVAKGYRTTPYLAPFIQYYIVENGGELIYTSDAHSKEGVGYGIE